MPSVQPPFSALADLEVFTTESHAAQVLVRSTASAVRAHVDNQVIGADVVGGVAAISVESLEPATTYSVEIETSHGATLGHLTFQTRSDMGPVTAKFATISDVHLGLTQFGVGKKLSDDDRIPYALRCATAAIDEATAWGAQLLIIKGDLTESGKKSEWALAEELVSNTSLPILLTAGNHDVMRGSEVIPSKGAASIGLAYEPVQTFDLPGIRIVVADTSRPRRGTGDLARVSDELVDAVTGSDPAFVAFHHNIQRAPVTWFWPPGISSTNANPVVNSLVAANPHLFLSSGHTHRNRVHRLGQERSVPYTEVSSTSDYPGVWAGYEVSRTMIRQSVRRIATPGAIEWTERTRSVLGGIWPRWSQGRLDDRCVDVDLR